MTDAPKLLIREAFETDVYLRCDCHEQINQTCDKCAIRAHIAALEAERDAAYARGLEDAAKACEDQEIAYGSPEYATCQPISSMGERLACRTCAEAIRALKPGKAE